MRTHIPYAALGVALVAGAPSANAQNVVTPRPGAIVIAQQPAQTVETIRTVRTERPARRMANRHVDGRRMGTVVTTTTTRTIVREPAAPVVSPAVEAITQPVYSEVVQTPVAAEPAYTRPLYDVVTTPVVPIAPAATGPYVGAAPATVSGTPLPAYRYVYESDRILVIDPYTDIAVQAIPR